MPAQSRKSTPAVPEELPQTPTPAPASTPPSPALTPADQPLTRPYTPPAQTQIVREPTDDDVDEFVQRHGGAGVIETLLPVMGHTTHESVAGSDGPRSQQELDAQA
jgi:hypothetical protein